MTGATKLKSKIITKQIIDLAMLVIFLLLLPYFLLNPFAHEMLGIIWFVLFTIHHLINAGWYRRWFKGRYNRMRLFFLVINLALLICMLGLFLSSLRLTQHILPVLFTGWKMSSARIIHQYCAYTGLILISVHLGFYWHTIMSSGRKLFSLENFSVLKWFNRSIVIMLSIFGIFSFNQRFIVAFSAPGNKLIKAHFSQPIYMYWFEFITVIVLFTASSYYLIRLNNKIKKNSRE